MAGKILNLTQHVATEEQMRDGIFEPSPEDKQRIKSLLTFDEKPTPLILRERAEQIGDIVIENYMVDKVMIGGAPYFMRYLEDVFDGYNIKTYYSFSKRVSIDEHLPDGSVVKRTKFVYEGLI